MVEEAHNFDLHSIVTPIDVGAYQALLAETGYDQDKTKFLVGGFQHGFDIGYRGPRDVTIQSKNMRCRVGSKTHLWNMVIAEVKQLRYAGPFKNCPYDHYIQSPLGKTGHITINS